MEPLARILIVEDDMVIAANMSLQLTNMGFEIIDIESRGEQAIYDALENRPDIILMDIKLKGMLSGIEVAEKIGSKIDSPIIYITANIDAGTFEKAKHTRPYAFVPKPINYLELKRTILLALEHHKPGPKPSEPVPVAKNTIEVLNDRVFVRQNGKMKKLLFEEILYIEADRNYSNIVMGQGDCLLAVTLKSIENKLPKGIFQRIHRSYVVNLSKLDVVADSHIEIGRKTIPISKSHKDELLKRIKTL